MDTFLSLFFILLLFHCSGGKSCPENSRPHPSRCDSYFKCVVLPSKSHVWVPSKCDRGLVYEPNLKVCVLPGDDWECNLDDVTQIFKDEANVYVNSLDLFPARKRQPLQKIEPAATSKSDEEKDFIEVRSDSFDSDKNVVISSEKLESEENIESSGDGADDDNFRIEVKEDENNAGVDIPIQSKIDPKLSSQLQRLSQLIDGLKESYQRKESLSSDLRPDQLNAFLAHFNLKSEFDSIEPLNNNKQKIPDDGKISPNLMNEILNQQEKLKDETKFYSTTQPPRIQVINKNGLKGGSVIEIRPNSQLNLENVIPPAKHYRKPLPQQGGYSNSQIVVNRPEGSVMFSLPAQQSENNNRNEPHISEETLKTVLELSKQMVASQNVRQVIPSNGFFQPLLQPMYYPVQLPSYMGSHYPKKAQAETTEDENNFSKISSSVYNESPNFPNRRPTTIIQNNVLPIHIANKPPGKQDFEKNENHQLTDSYGNKFSDYIEYPPYNGNNISPNQHLNSYENYHVTTEAALPNHNLQPQHDTPSLYTASPHLDDSTANQVVNIERYPTVSYANPPTNQYLTNHRYTSQNFQYQNSLPSPFYQGELNPSTVKIRPNSYGTSNTPDHYASDEDHFNSDKNGVNHQIVNNPLTPNLDQNHHIKGTPGSSNQLVNLGGSFISLDIYQNQLLPALNGNSDTLSNIEVITCNAGVRQANISDCTKYYVCSKKDGKVLSYSCPPYTAFNAQSRICDAKTYAVCNPEALFNRFTVAENRKIQMEALKALQEAKRIRDEAIQAQNLANLIRLETQKVINKTIDNTNPGLQEPTILSPSFVTSYQDSPEATATSTTTTAQPPILLYGHKRKKYYCKEGEKIADQTSVLNYYICYKTKDGAMKGHKMTCSAGLMFCARTALCTLPRRCNAQ